MVIIQSLSQTLITQQLPFTPHKLHITKPWSEFKRILENFKPEKHENYTRSFTSLSLTPLQPESPTSQGQQHTAHFNLTSWNNSVVPQGSHPHKAPKKEGGAGKEGRKGEATALQASSLREQTAEKGQKDQRKLGSQRHEQTLPSRVLWDKALHNSWRNAFQLLRSEVEERRQRPPIR